MSKTGEKSPRPATSGVRQAAGTRPPRTGRQPREVFGRFFETLGKLDPGGRSDREGAR